jgi:hypothetical protein
MRSLTFSEFSMIYNWKLCDLHRSLSVTNGRGLVEVTAERTRSSDMGGSTGPCFRNFVGKTFKKSVIWNTKVDER